MIPGTWADAREGISEACKNYNEEIFLQTKNFLLNRGVTCCLFERVPTGRSRGSFFINSGDDEIKAVADKIKELVQEATA